MYLVVSCYCDEIQQLSATPFSNGMMCWVILYAVSYSGIVLAITCYPAHLFYHIIYLIASAILIIIRLNYYNSSSRSRSVHSPWSVQCIRLLL